MKNGLKGKNWLKKKCFEPISVPQEKTWIRVVFDYMNQNEQAQALFWKSINMMFFFDL